MKYSSNRYYVEKYEKCSVCGKLVFEDKIEKINDVGAKIFYCTEWCVTWEIKKKNKR